MDTIPASTASGRRVPAIGDVRAAAERLRGQAVRTRLVRNDRLDELTGARVFLKPENLQRTGSFKFRGAYNAISALPDDVRKRGVVACSSGNHAQGVAAAAALHGIDATIVMPADAPVTKLEGTRRLGAGVVTYDRASEDRDAIADALCRQSGATFVHPYDNPDVIAGQGTAGLEIAEDLAALGLSCDAALMCTGGGGLTAGVSLALKDRFAACALHAVEPEDFDDTARSLETGEVCGNARNAGSVCDALLTASPGEISFTINRRLLAGGLRVNDAEALAAVAWAFANLKLVLEPGGAVALAALLADKLDVRGKTVVAMLSGGNIDAQMFARALAGGNGI